MAGFVERMVGKWKNWGNLDKDKGPAQVKKPTPAPQTPKAGPVGGLLKKAYGRKRRQVDAIFND